MVADTLVDVLEIAVGARVGQVEADPGLEGEDLGDPDDGRVEGLYELALGEAEPLEGHSNRVVFEVGVTRGSQLEVKGCSWSLG